MIRASGDDDAVLLAYRIIRPNGRLNCQETDEGIRQRQKPELPPSCHAMTGRRLQGPSRPVTVQRSIHDVDNTMLEAHIDSILTLAEPSPDSNENLVDDLYDFRDQTITDRVRAKIGMMVRERLAPPPEGTYTLHRKLSDASWLCARSDSGYQLGIFFDRQPRDGRAKEAEQRLRDRCGLTCAVIDNMIYHFAMVSIIVKTRARDNRQCLSMYCRNTLLYIMIRTAAK